jgi:hypothetical protein
MEQLDKQKFALAKTINERQAALTGIEGKVGKLREEGEELVKDRKAALERSDDLDSEACVPRSQCPSLTCRIIWKSDRSKARPARC